MVHFLVVFFFNLISVHVGQFVICPGHFQTS